MMYSIYIYIKYICIYIYIYILALQGHFLPQAFPSSPAFFILDWSASSTFFICLCLSFFVILCLLELVSQLGCLRAGLCLALPLVVSDLFWLSQLGLPMHAKNVHIFIQDCLMAYLLTKEKMS